MVFLWSFLASGLAVLIEALFRRGWVWHEHLWFFIPAGIAVNFLVYKIVTAAPTFLLAFVIFALSNVIVRVLVSQFWLGEPVARGNLLAVMALVLAIAARYFWK